MPVGHRIAVRRRAGDSALCRIHPLERDGGGPLKVLISAAEASSDVHGAALLRALQTVAPVRAFGIGGPALQLAGLRPVVDARDLLVAGFSEILGRLPRIFRALRLIERTSADEKPDVAVLIDYPDFHFRLARRLRRQGVPVVYYIPPKVWVWRKGRVKLLRSLFSRVLCIFPFEEEFLRLEGVPVSYVGNPLLDELPLDLSRTEARKAVGVDPHERLLVLMPGSRPSELKIHIPLMLEAVLLLADRFSPLRVHMSLPPTTAIDPLWESRARQVESEAAGAVRITLGRGDSASALVAADVALVKSGTSTLEAALLGCPHVVVYRPSPLTAWIFKNLIRYRGPVGLVNLATGWKPGDPYAAQELLCEHATAVNLAESARRLLSDETARNEMRRRFSLIREKLAGDVRGGSPSAKAAQEILAVAAGSSANKGPVS